MKNFSTWLLVLFMAMFWVFRIIIAFMNEFNMDIGGLAPLNAQYEIILLFVTLACMILIVKRKLVGALIYLLAYGMYFGIDFYNKITTIISGGALAITGSLAAFVSMIGIILPIAALLDMLADKARKLHPVDKKTDWFYRNEKFDIKKDERADKNNYRTM